MKLIPGEWRYVEDDGTFLPWYTGPCLEWLKTLDLQEMWVYEFGVGDSTVWYDKNGAVVMGVDSNPLWIYRPDVVHIPGVWQAATKEDYLSLIEVMKPEIFDIIVIDGEYRDECTEVALKYLKPGGYLIVDNFEQPSFECDWTKTKELIKDMDQVLFKEPEHPSGWQTLVVKK